MEVIMKRTLTLVILLSLVGLWAQKDTETHNIGFMAGQLCRPGVGYRQWFNDWGFQVNGMLMAEQDREPEYYDYREGDYYAWGRKLEANLGVSLMKTLNQNDNKRFYALVGYGLHHSERKLWESNYPSMSYPTAVGYEVSNRHYWGTGVGLEMQLLENLLGFVEIPITFQSNGEIMMYIPQIGIFYHF